MRRNLSNRFWIIVIGCIFAIAVILTLALGRTPANQAQVYQDGVLIKTLVLSEIEEPYTFAVDCDSGMNVISVERGRICVSDADCHDKLCVRQGWISGGTTPIVCLPHGLVITLDRSVEKSRQTDGADVDAVVG